MRYKLEKWVFDICCVDGREGGVKRVWLSAAAVL